MKSVLLIGAISWVFLTSDGVYTPFRLIAGFGLLVCGCICAAIIPNKVTK